MNTHTNFKALRMAYPKHSITRIVQAYRPGMGWANIDKKINNDVSARTYMLKLVKQCYTQVNLEIKEYSDNGTELITRYPDFRLDELLESYKEIK